MPQRARDTIGSSFLTFFWRCDLLRFSSRTTAERGLSQPTVNGFARESPLPKGPAMLIRSDIDGNFEANRASIPAASIPALLLGELLLLIGP
jgi:hypothetical protein